jgi:hypothetical protein
MQRERAARRPEQLVYRVPLPHGCKKGSELVLDVAESTLKIGTPTDAGYIVSCWYCDNELLYLCLLVTRSDRASTNACRQYICIINLLWF